MNRETFFREAIENGNASTFYATMDALGNAYKMPSLDEFVA